MIWRRSAADLPTRPLAASHGRRHHPHSATYGTVLAAFSTSRPTCQVPVPPQLPVRRAPRKEPQCSSRRCPRRGVVPAAGRHVSASRQDRDPHVERQVVFLPAVGLDGLLGIHSRGRRVWPQRRPRGCVAAPLTKKAVTGSGAIGAPGEARTRPSPPPPPHKARGRSRPAPHPWLWSSPTSAWSAHGRARRGEAGAHAESPVPGEALACSTAPSPTAQECQAPSA